MKLGQLRKNFSFAVRFSDEYDKRSATVPGLKAFYDPEERLDGEQIVHIKDSNDNEIGEVIAEKNFIRDYWLIRIPVSSADIWQRCCRVLRSAKWCVKDDMPILFEFLF
jgi:hypothetical protein